MGTKKVALKNLKKSWKAMLKERGKIIGPIRREYAKMMKRAHRYNSKAEIMEIIGAKFGVVPRTVYRYVNGTYDRNGKKQN